MLFAHFGLHKANHAYGFEMQKQNTKELKPGNHCFIVVYACKQLIFIRTFQILLMKEMDLSEAAAGNTL